MHITAAQQWRDLRQYFPKAVILKLQDIESPGKYVKCRFLHLLPYPEE